MRQHNVASLSSNVGFLARLESVFYGVQSNLGKCLVNEERTRLGWQPDWMPSTSASGRGVIRLQTDDSSRPTVTFALAAQRVRDWFRPNCYQR